ncbi:MAG: monooxygenase FAD-binding protein [Fibrobacteres bacterium]|nr:monooxygenase FAD-binding protein [Fibrobacterota bacterium]
MMLAGELALAGVDVAIVERRADQKLAGRRAGGIHARTIEVLDQRGIADRFLSQGKTMQITGFNMVPLDMSDFPTRHPYGLALTQNHIERILAEWIDGLAVKVYREREVAGFKQDDDGVRVDLAGGTTLRARYLVGCDGGRSLIRKLAGIGFPGWDPTTSWMIAEVDLTEPKLGWHQDALGLTHAIGRVEESGQAGLVLMERQVGATAEPTLRDLSEALIAAYGTDFGARNPVWISRFTDMARQADAYRDRRVLLAGDAAHVHAPVGGQGLNTGVQDAVNLGWKLAQVVKGESPPTLLDTYHSERHPVAARVLRTTMAQVALRRPDDRTKVLGDKISEWLRLDGMRKTLAGEMSGLDIRYDSGEGHPLLGRRVPDLDVMMDGGTVRIFSLLHKARPVLMNFGEAGAFDIGPWAGRVRLADVGYGGAWELPVLGAVPGPSAVLIRPDGYAAWVGEQGQAGLAEALAKWFGAGTRS